MIGAITAGGRVDGAFATAIGTGVKALARIGGPRRLIDASIDAARAAGCERVIVIGNEQVREHCGERIDECIEAAPDGRENLRRALRCADGNDLLFLASDLPFVNAAAIDDFLGRLEGAQLAMPLAEGGAYEQAFPGAAVHTARIGSERVVNGSIFFFAAGAAEKIEGLAQDFFAARKSLRRMAALSGPALLAKFLTGSIRVADVERRAEKVLKVKAKAVRRSSPLLCYDIDSLEDYRYALQHLVER
jgi:molybdopterin-guanine dinucleotide biosynthesis protein A